MTFCVVEVLKTLPQLRVCGGRLKHKETNEGLKSRFSSWMNLFYKHNDYSAMQAQEQKQAV